MLGPSVRTWCLRGLVALSSITLASITLASITLAGCSGSSFPVGTGTATITWHSIAPSSKAAQPFTGTVAGIPVSGNAVAAPPLSSGSLTSLPARLKVARWTGAFQGAPFSLNVSFNTGDLQTPNAVTVDVDGKVGSQRAQFVVGPAPANAKSITFHGTVGHHLVTGSVRPASARGSTNQATATFTVSG